MISADRWRVFERFRDWDEPDSVAPAGAGWRFTHRGERFVYRSSEPVGSRAARLASDRGWGPPWIDGGDRGFVVGWVDGAKPRTDSERARVVELVHEIHGSGVEFAGRPDAGLALQEVRRRYESCGRALSAQLASRVEAAQALAAELILGARPGTLHGDLHPANAMVTDNGVLLLDWEYAGFGDRDWDWGYWAASSQTRPINERAARYAILAQLVWELWGGPLIP